MFASFFGNKYEEAAELLEKACNNYKLAKAWGKAAEGFELLADCHLKSDSKHDAATACVEAANAHKKVNPTEAVRCLLAAVGHYTDMGRLSIAAKHLKDVAEVREKEDDVEGALAAYVQAADLFAGEENVSTANGCKLKVAELSATAERYQVAIDAFEEVAKASMGNNLLKFSVKGYLLNAGICRLCAQEPVGVKNALERYEDIDPTFAGKGGEAFGGAGGCRGTGRPGWIRVGAGGVRRHVQVGPVEDHAAPSRKEEDREGGGGGGGRSHVSGFDSHREKRARGSSSSQKFEGGGSTTDISTRAKYTPRVITRASSRCMPLRLTSTSHVSLETTDSGDGGSWSSWTRGRHTVVARGYGMVSRVRDGARGGASRARAPAVRVRGGRLVGVALARVSRRGAVLVGGR